jgi:hypothetical protein
VPFLGSDVCSHTAKFDLRPTQRGADFFGQHRHFSPEKAFKSSTPITQKAKHP